MLSPMITIQICHCKALSSGWHRKCLLEDIVLKLIYGKIFFFLGIVSRVKYITYLLFLFLYIHVYRSLGCVVLEMFAGERPWSNLTDLAAMFKVILLY